METDHISFTRLSKAVELLSSSMNYVEDEHKNFLTGILEEYKGKIDGFNHTNFIVVDVTNYERGKFSNLLKKVIQGYFKRNITEGFVFLDENKSIHDFPDCSLPDEPEWADSDDEDDEDDNYWGSCYWHYDSNMYDEYVDNVRENNENVRSKINNMVEASYLNKHMDSYILLLRRSEWYKRNKLENEYMEFLKTEIIKDFLTQNNLI